VSTEATPSSAEPRGLPDARAHLSRILDECAYLSSLMNATVHPNEKPWKGTRHWGTRNYAAAMRLIRVGNAVKELESIGAPPLRLFYDEAVPAAPCIESKDFARMRDKLAHASETDFQTVWLAVTLHVPVLFRAVQAELGRPGSNGADSAPA
jgi:uncharacterized protein with HEPN domain